jgi:hypothetical protein
VDPALAKVAAPRWAKNPLTWTDFRAKMDTLPALGELRCEAEIGALLECLEHPSPERESALRKSAQ